MKEYRCPECGRLLFKTDAAAGNVQTLCRECKAIRTVAVKAATVQTTRKYSPEGR